MANLATFKDIQDRVITYGYSEAHRTQIKAWINDAYRELCQLRRWSWLTFTDTVNTVAGTRTTALPAPAGRELRSVIEIKPNDAALGSVALTFEDPNSHDPHDFFHTNLVTRTSRGAPYRFTVDGSTIYWDPIPDRAYAFSVRHYDVPTTELSGDADTLLTPDDSNQVLVYAALLRAAAHDRNPQMMGVWQSMMLEHRQSLEAHERTKVVHGTSRARVWPGYGRRFG